MLAGFWEVTIKKEQTSFIAGARTTYANWLLKLLPESYHDSKAAFSDVNLHISHRMGPRDDIYLSGYASNDRFNLGSDTAYRYSNTAYALLALEKLAKPIKGTIELHLTYDEEAGGAIGPQTEAIDQLQQGLGSSLVFSPVQDCLGLFRVTCGRLGAFCGSFSRRRQSGRRAARRVPWRAGSSRRRGGHDC